MEICIINSNPNKVFHLRSHGEGVLGRLAALLPFAENCKGDDQKNRHDSDPNSVMGKFKNELGKSSRTLECRHNIRTIIHISVGKIMKKICLTNSHEAARVRLRSRAWKARKRRPARLSIEASTTMLPLLPERVVVEVVVGGIT